jgi:hypothetical protein
LVFLLPLSGADDPDAVFRKRVDDRPLRAFELSDADITFLAILISAKAARQTHQAMRGHVPEVNAVNADDFLTLVLVPLEFHNASIFSNHSRHAIKFKHNLYIQALHLVNTREHRSMTPRAIRAIEPA